MFLEERSDIVGLLSDDKGRIDVNTGQFPLLKYEINWQTMITPPNLSQAINDYWDSFEIRNPTIPFTMIGPKIAGMKDSHFMLYQKVRWEQRGDSFLGMMFVWYCEDQSRLYSVVYYDLDIELENNALKFIETMQCHLP